MGTCGSDGGCEALHPFEARCAGKAYIVSRNKNNNCVSSCVERKLPLSPVILHAEVTSSASSATYVYDGWLPHVAACVVTLFLAGQRDSRASTRSKYQWDSRHCSCSFAGLELESTKDSDDFRNAKRGRRML